MKLSSSDRKSLIKLAGTLPKGSAERRAILVGLKKVAGSPPTKTRVAKMSDSQVKNFFDDASGSYQDLLQVLVEAYGEDRAFQKAIDNLHDASVESIHNDAPSMGHSPY